MYNFMTRSSFDDEGMLEELRKETIGLLQHPSGMITGDMFDFPKLGNNSVGIASQYCDRLGRFENCQSGVMEGYVGLGGCGITNYSLFMPEKWFGDDHSDLRKQCKVPEDLGFRTKPQMMLEMILETHNSGTFKAKYIGLGREFGGDCAFLDSLPEDLTYFADIPATFCVFLGRTGNIVPEYYGSVRNSVEATSLYPRSVEDIARDCSIPWVDVALGSGAKGPIITREKCIKVIVVRNGNPGKDIWLYVRQLNDSSIKYSLCNECLDATPGAIRIPALMRCSMERCFDEHKNNLGVASYEVRSWPGWRRHILFTLIAHSFVLKLRRKFSTRIDSP
jgi:SRSO17 transposase